MSERRLPSAVASIVFNKYVNRRKLIRLTKGPGAIPGLFVWCLVPYDLYAENKLHDPSKQYSRDRVTEFYKAHCHEPEIRYLGLPSLFYKYERQLIANFEDRRVTCFGIERRTDVFEGALNYMPGSKPETMTTRNKKKPNLAFNESHILFRGAVSDVLSEQFNEFSKPRLNAAWLDMCGMLCDSNVRCMAQLVPYLDPEVQNIPIAFTALAAREHDWVAGYVEQAKWQCQHSTTARVLAFNKIMHKLLHGRTWDYMHHFAYSSVTAEGRNVPMLLICGLLRKVS